MKTIFIPCRGQADVELVINNILQKVPHKRIGLVATAQYVHQLGEIKSGLERGGKEVILSKGRPNRGQIIGCDVRAASRAKRAECFVYLGTGLFHPIRVATETGKPTYVAHPSGDIEAVSGEMVMKHAKIRAARIHRFKEANVVGVLVSTKPGQNRFKEALRLKEQLRREKETFIFVANEIKPDYFTGYGVDAWVNTACPRIADDKFGKPVVDISEIENG